MAEMVDRERRVLLDAAKKIHTYKLMQARGYERLVKKAKDDRTKRLLAEIGADEVKDSEYWSQKIQELAGQDEKPLRVSSANRKVGLMMGILGTRGLLEWAIIAEGEGYRRPRHAGSEHQ